MNTTMDAMIDGAVVLGLGVVAPLALGGWRRWLPAAAAAGIALRCSPVADVPDRLRPGLAVLLLVPAHVAALAALRAGLRSGRRLDGPQALASVWALVATGALTASVLGHPLLGIGEPIVRLTAVHFLFAGTGALVLAAASGSTLALRCTAAGPVVVALGFVSGWAPPQVGGAALLAVGVCATAAAHLRAAARPGPTARRALLATSGLAIWAPMALAVAWAAGQHWPVPALSIPDMVRWHGAPNALAFVLCGLLATRSAVAAPCDARASHRRADMIEAAS